jgi:hypothetical protein
LRLKGKHIGRNEFLDSVLEAFNINVLASGVAAFGNVEVFGIHEAVKRAAHVSPVNLIGDLVSFPFHRVWYLRRCLLYLFVC